ncbi:MAG: hypothetical protein CL666_08640 [Balneola sp.]|nr:hypothetical protein [Balneola sp.]|tara:strand:+ start:20823 stop:21188 length:366 start_codon:yes stop_codon:yes gene_type:complete
MSIFGVDIQGIVSDAFSGQLKPVTLTRENKGDYDPPTDSYRDGADPDTYTTEGIVEDWAAYLVESGAVEANTRKILMIAKPLGTEPKQGDTITIEGDSYMVVGIPERDPDTATWVVQGRVG